MKPFLDVIWQDLLVINYRVEPKHLSLLEKHLPAGTELDDFHGEHFVSVVAFRFRKTRILGIPMPFYRDFPEINLRFYVRRKVDGHWRRGVVFIKEIIPHRLPAWIANTIFRENFHVHPLTCHKDENVVSYTWDHSGEYQKIETHCKNEPHPPAADTLDEHIIEHYWAYKGIDQKRTAEFEVTHRPWRVTDCEKTDIHLDLARVYGREWQQALSTEPVSVFYADGSRVGVTRPHKIEP